MIAIGAGFGWAKVFVFVIYSVAFAFGIKSMILGSPLDRENVYLGFLKSTPNWDSSQFGGAFQIISSN